MNNELNLQCVSLLNEISQNKEVSCFKSALRHIELAERIQEVDHAMCYFRLITAEEEAASGLMYCLIRLAYPGSENLQPHDHQFKNALYPFVSVLTRFLIKKSSPVASDLRLVVQGGDSTKKLLLQVDIAREIKGIRVVPNPPLNFSLNKVGGGTYDYSSDMSVFIKSRGARTVKEFVRREANYRNKILYASDTQMPEDPVMNAGVMDALKERVMFMLRVYLLVYPYEQHQMYVSHALNEFVKLMNIVKSKGAKGK